MDKKEINELEKALDFFEEITWLLDRKNFKLNGKPEMLRRILHNQVDSDLANINFADNESDIQQLIGILPGLFQDLDLFPTNKLIVSFAEELLHINIKRGEKRSRYELIGFIVCETSQLSNSQLQDLVAKLKEIIRNSEKMNSMKKAAKSEDFSWNETIRILTER